MDRYARPTRSDSAVEAAHMLTGVEVSDTPAPPAPAPPAPEAPAKRAPAPKAPAKGTAKGTKASGSGQASGSGKAPAQPKASGSGLRGR